MFIFPAESQRPGDGKRWGAAANRGNPSHIRENLSEEELTLFDILLKPAPDLTDAERSQVKAVARELLEQVKALLVLNWRAKEASRARLKLAIEDALDLGLPRAYTPELYQQKCNAIFEHFYVSYPERDASVYADTKQA